MKAYDVMTTNFVAAKESETLMEVNNKLLQGEFNGVPIIDNRNAVIGMITSIDILNRGHIITYEGPTAAHPSE
jgi:CBS domain-containing protein